MNQLAGLGHRRHLVLADIHQRRAEHLCRNRQLATVLRIDRVAQLDHPMAHTIDQLFIGA